MLTSKINNRLSGDPEIKDRLWLIKNKKAIRVGVNDSLHEGCQSFPADEFSDATYQS